MNNNDFSDLELYYKQKATALKFKLKLFGVMLYMNDNDKASALSKC